jgi:alpha-beta hydrolase superfamily lysophospholipase
MSIARGYRGYRGLRAGALVLAAVLTAPAARAQEPVVDQGLYRLFQAGAELGRETYRRTPSRLETSMVIPLLGLRRATSTEFDAAGHASRFRLEDYNLTADTLTVSYDAVAAGDSLRFTQTRHAGANRERQWSKAATPVDAFVASQTLVPLFDLVSRAARRDTTYRVWGVEADSAVSFTVTIRGDSVRVSGGGADAPMVLDAAGRVALMDVPLQRLRVERWVGGDTLAPLPGMHRPTPDYTAPADAPYTAVEVRVPVRPATGDTFSLAGTLTLPKRGSPPYAAAVMITGSGLEDRDENLWPLVQGYRPFRQIAERLAEAGIAVLRVDDRSFGASTGNAENATTADFADDVAAEVAWLRTRPEIAPGHIALIGHSEGGVIAPMVAVRGSQIAAIVLMAGTSKPGTQVLRDQAIGPFERASDLTPERRAELEAAAIRQVLGDSATTSPWMKWFRAYDPLPTARRVRQPVLILQGEVDRQVSAGQADTLAAAMRAAGNRDVTEHVFPHLNHLFLVSPTDGSPSEYPALKDTAIGRDVLDTLADWVAQRLAPGGARRGN